MYEKLRKNCLEKLDEGAISAKAARLYLTMLNEFANSCSHLSSDYIASQWYYPYSLSITFRESLRELKNAELIHRVVELDDEDVSLCFTLLECEWDEVGGAFKFKSPHGEGVWIEPTLVDGKVVSWLETSEFGTIEYKIMSIFHTMKRKVD